MPSGPNIFFVAPDGDLIISGSTDGSDTPNDLFGGNCVASSSNRGALSSFVIGSPTAATSLNIRINHSGGIDKATYIWKSGADSESFTNYYGEPDRRWEWDIHSPLEVDPNTANSTANKRNWRDGGITTNDIPTGCWQGCALENINKEFLYVVEPYQLTTKIGVYYRDISNKEAAWSAAEITGLKDGTIFNGSYGSVFAVCTHTDNKIKLALIFDQDIDIYESSDGIDFSLVCELSLSRFCGFRLRSGGEVQSLKIASSGAYLKILFVNDDLYESLTTEEVLFHEQRELYSEVNGQTEFQGFVNKFSKVKYGTITNMDDPPIVANQDQDYDRTSFYIGSITSPDGGATWSLSDLPSYSGSRIPCLEGHGFSLTGLSDGSGQFILMFKVDELFRYTSGVGDRYTPHRYHGAISSGNSPFVVHDNLQLFNLFGSGTPYLGCNNDWIWFISASEFSSIMESWIGLNLIGGYNTKGTTNNPTIVKDHQIYYIRLNSDVSFVEWTKLGSSDVYFDPISVSNAYSAAYSTVSSIDESVVTGSVGSMHYSFYKGNIYQCGASMSWVRMVYNKQNQKIDNNICYSKFSGWQTLPPNATNTDLLSIDGAIERSERKPFIHQPSRVLSKPEFCYMWGYPSPILPNGQNTTSATQYQPSSTDTLWRTQRDSNTFIGGCAFGSFPVQKGLSIYSGTTVNGTRGYLYFIDPAVPDKTYYAPNATGMTFDIKPAESLTLREKEFPQIVWGGRPRLDRSRYHGCNISFVIGGVSTDAAFVNNTSAWTDANNDIGGFTGVKMRTYVSGKDNVDTTNELAAMEVHVQFTSTEVRVYLPYSLSYSGSREIIKITPDTGVYGANPFYSSFWECRLSFNTQFFGTQNTTSYLSEPTIQLSIRKYGSNDWLTSSVAKDDDFWAKSATVAGNEFKAIQFAAVGIFKHTSTASLTQRATFKYFRLVRGHDLGQYNMFATVTDESKIDAVRGRNASSLPCLISTKQSIVWGGASGYEADTYTYETKSNYDASNAIKYPSPQIQYRTTGSTSNVKTGNASIVASLPDSNRSAGNNAFLHGGIALFGINSEKVEVQYDDNSSFSSPSTIFESDTKVATGRIDQQGFNNFIKVSFDGDTLNSNDSKYSQTKNHTYYIKFSTLSAGVTPDINGLSFTIKKQSGDYLYLDIPDFDLNNTGGGLGTNLIGTTIQIFSDNMIALFDKTANVAVPNPEYMKIIFKDHLGTESYYKVGSVLCGMTYGFQNVPLNWEHDNTVSGNVKSFQSRSGIRWGYEDGPSVSSYSATIVGDVFEQERDNILKIMQNATEFNNRPVAMVFDDGKYTSPTVTEHVSFNIKMYVDPDNILYGTFNNQLQLVNAGWGYDENKQKWVPIGDMQITVTETV